MCTVTWLATREGFDLFSNRDERHTRADAAPPVVHVRRGAYVLAPIDPDGGGSWITVNQQGLALCLLNEYATPEDLDPDRAFTSRGQLVMDLAGAPTIAAVEGALRVAALSAYRSFRLLVLAPGTAPVLARWDRSELVLGHADGEALPLVSSPLDPQGAHAARAEELGRLRREASADGGAGDGRASGAAVLDAFHRSHAPERGSYSPCMHGEQARTRSRTRVTVAPTHVAMGYTDGAPCEVPESPALRLRR